MVVRLRERRAGAAEHHALGQDARPAARSSARDARIEIDGDFYRPSSFSLITRSGVETRYDVPHEGWGLRHQADEVARCLREGLLESPVMPLEESISIMATMDAVRAQGVR